MEDCTSFRVTRKFQFVTHCPNMFEDHIWYIKLGINILVVLVFKWVHIIRFYMDENIICFMKVDFLMMLLNFLLHHVFIHGQMILERACNTPIITFKQCYSWILLCPYWIFKFVLSWIIFLIIYPLWYQQ